MARGEHAAAQRDELGGRLRAEERRQQEPQDEPGHERAHACAPFGSVTVNVVPRPGRLTTSIWPPCASAIHLQIASPSPAPARSPVRVRAVSARQKRSKTCGKSPGAIPTPVSATLSVTRPCPFGRAGASSCPSWTCTRPPWGVYFTALVNRFRIN